MSQEPRVYVKENTTIVLNVGQKSLEVTKFDAMQLLRALQNMFEAEKAVKSSDELENRLKAIEHRLVALESKNTNFGSFPSNWPNMNQSSPFTITPYTVTCTAGETK